MNAIATPTPYAKPKMLNGISVIDADTHVSEWHDLWTSRAPAGFKDRVPQVKKVGDQLHWVIDGDKSLGMACPSSAIHKDGSKSRGEQFVWWQLDEVHAGSYNVKARVAYMDQSGIAAQIAYPNVLGFGGQRAAMVDPELRLLATQLYNDAMAEMQAESGNRIFPMALLPWWDLQQTLAETRRCHKMGLRGVNTNSDPQTHQLPDLSDPHWHPLWETCIELGLPVNFHIGASESSMAWFSSGVWPSHDFTNQLAFGGTMTFLSNARVLVNIILSRFLERFPALKIVSVESGIGYLPFLLECTEYQMREFGIKYSVRPIDLFRRQIYACSWFEKKDFVTSARSLGIDNVMFETDFPHPTCLYPDALEYLSAPASELSHDERRKVFGGNAARVYNIAIE
jgi:predicted TIM-barrel fold metal-dependent hydrolase